MHIYRFIRSHRILYSTCSFITHLSFPIRSKAYLLHHRHIHRGRRRCS